MYQFNSIQEALGYIFEGHDIQILNLFNSPHPWFFVDEVRVAIGYNSDNNQFTRYMEHRDEYLGILTLPQLQANLETVKLTEARFINNYGGNKNV